MRSVLGFVRLRVPHWLVLTIFHTLLLLWLVSQVDHVVIGQSIDLWEVLELRLLTSRLAIETKFTL